MQAAGLLASLAIASLLFLPLIYVCGAVAALLAMQLGLTKAASATAWAMGLLCLSTALLLGTPWMGMGLGVLIWLPALLLGAVVGNAGALAAGLQWLMLASLLVTGSFYGLLTDPAAWWHERLDQYVQANRDDGWWQALGVYPQKLIDSVAGFMPGSLGMGLFLGFAICLLLGRYWPAALFRAGAFGQEFRVLAFGRIPAVALAMLLLLGTLQVMAAVNLAVVLLTVFMLQGLAVAHALVKARHLSVLWLAGLYGVLMLIPQVIVLVAAVGASDNWMNWRVMGSGRFQA